MELENQVTSLELSKELKENGYPQEGLWWWIDDDRGFILPATDKENLKGWRKITRVFIAPTVAELGEKLPRALYIDTNNYWFGTRKIPDNTWDVLYDSKYNTIRTSADTEVNARAKMWLWLKKEGKL